MNRLSSLARWSSPLWALLILLLPITSLPLISRLAGSSMVAAPAMAIVGLMLALFWLPAVLRGEGQPFPTLPLFIFVLLALISAAAALFLPLPAFRDASPLRNSLEAMITLAIGAAFFLAASTLVKTEIQLKHIFRWVSISGGIIIAWSLVQAGSWQILRQYPEWIRTIQMLISTSGNLYPERVTGLAFEPSWLAHQLNMLYLPYWMAASYRFSSAFSWKLFKRISIENILLGLGIIVLFLSLSRVGWLAFLLMVGALLLELNLRLIRHVRKQSMSRVRRQELRKYIHWIVPLVMAVGLVVLYLGLIFGAGFVLSKIDSRMEKLFNPELLQMGGLIEASNQLMFAERVVFWRTGFELFNDYPVLGVGPGNAGLFFPDKMTAFGWGLTEISTLMYQNSGIPNVKSLWSRILAENGLVGFSVFVAWLVVIAISARKLVKTSDRFLQAVGWMGALTLVGMVVEGFSVDTYALPYFWLSLGWTVAAEGLIAARGMQGNHSE